MNTTPSAREAVLISAIKNDIITRLRAIEASVESLADRAAQDAAPPALPVSQEPVLTREQKLDLCRKAARIDFAFESEKITRAQADAEFDALLGIVATPQPAEQMTEILRLRQALWEIYGILGFDTDGDPTPIALVGDIAALVVDAAKEHRKEYDDLLQPAEQAELSDEQIMQISIDAYVPGSDAQVLSFARAVLAKAKGGQS